MTLQFWVGYRDMRCFCMRLVHTLFKLATGQRDRPTNQQTDINMERPQVCTTSYCTSSKSNSNRDGYSISIRSTFAIEDGGRGYSRQQQQQHQQAKYRDLPLAHKRAALVELLEG